MAKNPEMQGGSKAAASTQSHVNVSEIKEGTVVLKDGSLRAVIVVSSTNFSLKSQEEQNALIAAYQGFLNSLDFPVEILIQSRKLDINGYLDKLRAIVQKQTNELLKLQTQEYVEYIAKLVEFASIMNKTFYVVVPFGVPLLNEGFFGKISKLLNPAGTITTKKQTFEEHREELHRRVTHISNALGGMGLRTIVLNTEELVELLYNSYNLSTASPVRIKSIDELELARPKDE